MRVTSSARSLIDSMWGYLDSARSSAMVAENAFLKSEAVTLNRIRQALWLVFAIGLATRLSPLMDIEGRLFWQFMTEDGYLMQTVARNMAIGLGMSSSAGEVPTNGVQPLSTVLFAGLHWIAGGERTTSIALVGIVSALVATAAAFVLYRVARELLSGLALCEELSRFIAAVWFIGPLNVAHSMNGLETGLYVLTMLGALYYYLTRLNDESTLPRWRQSLLLGLLLGLTFLARNDAVFFIAALLLSHLLIGTSSFEALRVRLVECLLAGALSVVVGLPWLISNYVSFGSVVPISGTSQSFNADFGENILLVPSNLLETMIPLLPIPRQLETNVLVVTGALVGIAGVLMLYWRWWGSHSLATRRAFATTLLFASALSIYYGLFFGAPHFIPRYLSILSPLLWLAFAVVVYLGFAATSWTGSRLASGLAVVAAATVAVSLLLSVHFYRKGTEHMHKQVVEWVRANAAPTDWVAAVQTGTLGYFHDRTLNLDGKVNPIALRELLKHGHALDYVSGIGVRYIVDWHGLSGWKDSPKAQTFNRNFELTVVDKDKNLAVYQRRSPGTQ